MKPRMIDPAGLRDVADARQRTADTIRANAQRPLGLYDTSSPMRRAERAEADARSWERSAKEYRDDADAREALGRTTYVGTPGTLATGERTWWGCAHCGDPLIHPPRALPDDLCQRPACRAATNAARERLQLAPFVDVPAKQVTP